MYIKCFYYYSLASVNKPQVMSSNEVMNSELPSPMSPKVTNLANEHYRLVLADLIQFENEILTGDHVRNVNEIISNGYDNAIANDSGSSEIYYARGLTIFDQNIHMVSIAMNFKIIISVFKYFVIIEYFDLAYFLN